MTRALTHEEAVEFFSRFYRGAHHIPGNRKGNSVKPFGFGWCVNHNSDLASFDSNGLTDATRRVGT